MSFKTQDPMAHEDMGTAFGCMQQAIAGIGETLCLEHASLLKVRDESPAAAATAAQRKRTVALHCAALLLQLVAGTSRMVVHPDRCKPASHRRHAGSCAPLCP